MLQSSSRFLNSLTEEASTTVAGNLFHNLTIFWLKKHALSCNRFSFHFQSMVMVSKLGLLTQFSLQLAIIIDGSTTTTGC